MLGWCAPGRSGCVCLPGSPVPSLVVSFWSNARIRDWKGHAPVVARPESKRPLWSNSLSIKAGKSKYPALQQKADGQIWLYFIPERQLSARTGLIALPIRAIPGRSQLSLSCSSRGMRGIIELLRPSSSVSTISWKLWKELVSGASVRKASSKLNPRS